MIQIQKDNIKDNPLKAKNIEGYMSQPRMIVSSQTFRKTKPELNEALSVLDVANENSIQNFSSVQISDQLKKRDNYPSRA